MRIHMFALMLVIAIYPVGHRQQVDSYNAVINCESISADLANTLARVAWLSHLPMVAELAQPLPKIEIVHGTYIVKELLQEIARQAPEYQWESEGKVIHFYNRKLKDAKFNFLSMTFPEFTMPRNVSELKLTFPQRENGLLQGFSGGGMLITGFGDANLEKDTLEPAMLKNVTGRDILLRAANERPTFLSIVVFPNAEPTKEQMEKDMNRNWFWQALKDQKAGPLYIQPSR